MAPSPSRLTWQLALFFMAALGSGAPPPAAAVSTNTSGPLCADLSPDGRKILGALTQAPTADDICSWVTEYLPNDPLHLINTCDKLAVVETSLTKASHRTSACDPGAPFQVFGSPAQLQDRRPLPAGAFDNVISIFEQEGATYSWMFFLVRSIQAWGSCFQEGLPWPPPAGWKTLAQLELPEDGASVTAGAVILDEAAGQLVVVIRGTANPFEWDLDWQYNQTESAIKPFPAPVHDGFGWAYYQIWPDIKDALDQVVVQDRTASQVFVTGHSLGAALATLVSYAAQQYLVEKVGAAAPVVDAVLLAPPNVGGPDFVEVFNAKVNARRVAFEYDVVPQTPCTPAMPTCTDELTGVVGAILDADNITAVPTDQPGDVDDWAYAQVGGSMPITSTYMPQDAASWGALDNLQPCWAEQFLLASHSCSYSCFTSQFAPPEATAENGCWLSPQPAGAPGSQCQSWPSDYPGVAETATEGRSIALTPADTRQPRLLKKQATS